MWTQQTCRKCGILKGIREFHLNNGYKSGRHPVCKDCVNAKREEERRKGSVLFRVHYDPLNSFTENSQFTQIEIQDMLNAGYLAVGTIFKNGRSYLVVDRDEKLLGKRISHGDRLPQKLGCE